MRDLWYYTKIGFLIGAGVVVALVAAFAVLLTPGFIAETMYGSPWGLIIGGPWVLACIISGSFVLTMAEEGKIRIGADHDDEGTP